MNGLILEPKYQSSKTKKLNVNPEDQSEDKCPNCGHNYSKRNFVQDGGSFHCIKCRTTFHFCKDDQVRYGSPGPSMCLFCKPSSTQIFK